jgi:hypothetical protein
MMMMARYFPLKISMSPKDATLLITSINIHLTHGSDLEMDPEMFKHWKDPIFIFVCVSMDIFILILLWTRGILVTILIIIVAGVDILP